MTSIEPVDILVVEDNDSERASIVQTLEAATPDVSILAVSNGTQALDYLLGRGDWAEREEEMPPRLILLDLEMPGDDGLSVLEQLRALQHTAPATLTPVVVFSDSGAASDIKESYRRGANSYITKPLSFPDYRAILESIARYWILLNKSIP